ncbi:MAG: hypothetical protein AAGM04_00765 [Pseudomonadota bacterium]
MEAMHLIGHIRVSRRRVKARAFLGTQIVTGFPDGLRTLSRIDATVGIPKAKIHPTGGIVALFVAIGAKGQIANGIARFQRPRSIGTLTAGEHTGLARLSKTVVFVQTIISDEAAFGDEHFPIA